MTLDDCRAEFPVGGLHPHDGHGWTVVAYRPAADRIFLERDHRHVWRTASQLREVAP